MTRRVNFKVIGGTILLMSFLTQQLLFEKFKADAGNLLSQYQHYSNAYNASLLYLNLYNSAALTTKVADVAIIHKAAQENMSGFAVQILWAKLPKEKQKEYLEELMQKVASVRDIDSYNVYMGVVNRIERQTPLAYTDRANDIQLHRNVAFIAYLTLYCIGTFLMVLGYRQEKRVVNVGPPNKAHRR